MKGKNSTLKLLICSLFLAVCSSACHDESQHKVEEVQNNEEVSYENRIGEFVDDEESDNREEPERVNPNKDELGAHIVNGWEIKVDRYRRKTSDMLDVTINPPKGVDDKASVTRIWMGDKNSESLKTKMKGHGHGDYEMHYDIDVKFEEGDDETQFSLEIETEKGKKLFKTIQF